MTQKNERETEEKLCEIKFCKWTISNFLQDKLSQKRTKIVKFAKIYPIKVFCETNFYPKTLRFFLETDKTQLFEIFEV